MDHPGISALSDKARQLRRFHFLRSALSTLLGILFCLVSIDSAAIAQEHNTAITVQEIGRGDFEKGLTHIIALARQGNGAATFLYAHLFLDIGDTENFEKYLRIAAEQGNPVAMKFYATGYFKGAFGKVDYSEARYWFEKSAELGNINSMVYLGMIYRDGLGVETSIETSYFWFTVAGIIKPDGPGDFEPEEFAVEIEPGLSKASIRRIRLDAESWIIAHPFKEPEGVPLIPAEPSLE